jgi:hypothetical protein
MIMTKPQKPQLEFCILLPLLVSLFADGSPLHEEKMGGRVGGMEGWREERKCVYSETNSRAQ